MNSEILFVSTVEGVAKRITDLGNIAAHSMHVVQLVKSSAFPVGGSELTGVEIGVGRGTTAMAVLWYLPNVVKHTMIDPWWPLWGDHPFTASDDPAGHASLELMEQLHAEAIGYTAFAGDRRQIIRDFSIPVSHDFHDRTLNYVFLDGDTTYQGVYRDIQAWWRKVKPGGLLFGHDYGRFGVQPAVDAFIQNTGLVLDLHKHALWAVRKPAT